MTPTGYHDFTNFIILRIGEIGVSAIGGDALNPCRELIITVRLTAKQVYFFYSLLLAVKISINEMRNMISWRLNNLNDNLSAIAMIYPMLHSIKNTLADLSDVSLMKLMRYKQSDTFVARITQQISHIGQWVYFVEFAAFNQAVIKRGGFTTALRTDK